MNQNRSTQSQPKCPIPASIAFLRGYSKSKGGLIPLDNVLESHAQLVAALSDLLAATERPDRWEVSGDTLSIPEAQKQARAVLASISQ